jgi:predicted nucleic acid-binding protein
MDIIDANAIVKILFNTDSTTLVEVLTVSMLRFVFYSLITFFIIFLLHLIAKALNKSMQLRQDLHGFI